MTDMVCAACQTEADPVDLRELETHWPGDPTPVVRTVCRKATACQRRTEKLRKSNRERSRVPSELAPWVR